MDWGSSTHRSNWIFDQEKLAQRHHAAQQKAVASMKRAREESPADAQEPDAKKAKDADVPITADEVALYLTYFERKLPQICRTLKFPVRVQATALVYFKRFYTVHSCLEYDAARIMPAAVYVAGKVEEAYISAESLAKQLNLGDAQAVLRFEVPLLQALDYDLLVHSPYRALRGLLAELAALRSPSSGDPAADGPEASASAAGAGGGAVLEPALAAASAEEVSKLGARAARALDAIMHSKAPLLFPPGQLATAALRSAARRSGLPHAAFLQHVAERGAREAGGAGDAPPAMDPAAAAQQLQASMAEIDRLVEASLAAEQGAEAAAADIDRRIKLWRRAQQAAAPGTAAGGQPDAE